MILLLTIAIVAVLTPSFVVILAVTQWVRPKVLVHPAGDQWGLLGPLPPDVRAFIAEHALQQAGAFRYRQTLAAFYPMNAGATPERTFHVLAAGGKFVVEIVTSFGPDHLLSTSRTTATLFMPRRPGVFTQAYPKTPLDELWRRHVEAETLLLQTGRVTIGEVDPDYERRTEHGIRRNAAFTRSLPLFWLRAIYWFWVKRFLLANKSVAQQIAAER